MPLASSMELVSASGREPEGFCAELFDHWRELSDQSPAADGIPVRHQIDMLTLPVRVLPWFFLHECVGHRYRSLIASTRVAESLGFEPKGRFIDELMPPEIYASRRDMFDVCLRNSRSVFYRGAFSKPMDRYIGYCRLLLPLHREPAGPVDMLCGLMMFFEKGDLNARDRRWIENGFSGLFDCLMFDSGNWRDWRPDPTEQPSDQPAA
ncbi:MAG: PAS domain-containing protein [Alphaproteobacteria bacterium]|nr:PAS domain-containing protein [Alphaproteobacteria bacterium]